MQPELNVWPIEHARPLANLAPGNYVAACMVVDPVSHKTHAAMGMLTGFTVAP